MSFTQGVLEELAPYTVANWDGDGATAISEETLHRVRAVLDSLPAQTLRPSVGPGYDGSVALFWETDGLYLHLDVAANGNLAYRARIPGLPEPHTASIDRSGEQMARLVNALRPTFGYIAKEKIPLMTVLGGPSSAHTGAYNEAWSRLLTDNFQVTNDFASDPATGATIITTATERVKEFA